MEYAVAPGKTAKLEVLDLHKIHSRGGCDLSLCSFLVPLALCDFIQILTHELSAASHTERQVKLTWS